ncbi:MAG TPA: MBL fold metallo-hydrolase [Tepidiformaceae bacterium]|nr:MBL fold metallo-hydrolase [Tepidiformaceae bacterium]
MHGLRLTFIGSGNAFSPGGLCCNGFLLNDRVLFEAPPQTLGSLNTVGVDPNELDVVVLSHHHGDHFLGLPFLLLHWKWKGRTRPVRIVGPRNTEALAKDIAQKVFPGVLDISYEIEWAEAEPGKLCRVNGLELDPVQVEHDDELSSTLGYAVRYHGRRLAYTGDTRLCDGVFDIARDAELMVSECASRTDCIPIHMNLVDDMPRVRAALPSGSPLILTHISPDVDNGNLANTLVAKDFETYRV